MSDNENMGQNPRVFISYSWDSPEHKLWVESFAQELRKSGIDARLDAWRDESQSIDDFMMVELERADFILAICTPQFKKKIVENAEGIATASGFEIGTAAALRRMGGKDVIPVLRAGEWTEAAPSNLLSYRFYDFTQSDVGEEFTQLRDRLLGHTRRPPELGRASGPAAAPELPDIFSKGSTPEPQQTTAAPRQPEATVARSAPPPAQQPQPAVSTPAKAGYSKAKVWGAVGAIILGLVVVWNLVPDPEEEAAGGEQAFASMDEPETSEMNAADYADQYDPVQEQVDPTPAPVPANTVSNADDWNVISGNDGCGIEKQVAPDSWIQVIYEPDLESYTFGTSDFAWGAHVQTDVLHPAAAVFQFDDDPNTGFIADVVGYDYDGIPGAYTHVGEDFVENLANYYYLHVYLNTDPYTDNQLMSVDLTGSTDAADELLACVGNL